MQLRKTSSHSAGYGGLIGKDSKRKGDLSFGLKDREDCVSRGVGEGTQSGLRDQQVQRHEVRRVWCLWESVLSSAGWKKHGSYPGAYSGSSGMCLEAMMQGGA